MNLYKNLVLQKDFINQEIFDSGYIVLRNIIPSPIICELRNFWYEYMRKQRTETNFVRSELLLGEGNFLSYSNTKEWCLYRNFEFLWNHSENIKTRDMCIEIHQARNVIQGFDPDFGLKYDEKNYGVYLSTSLYDANEGFLHYHSDGHGELPILHFMLPLSFKGRHYQTGGLFLFDRKGNKVDVDAICQEGDLIFFDGRIDHGVELIGVDGSLGGSSQSGRLAVFAIPTFFSKDATLGVLKRKINISLSNLKKNFKLNRKANNEY